MSSDQDQQPHHRTATVIAEAATAAPHEGTQEGTQEGGATLKSKQVQCAATTASADNSSSIYEEDLFLGGNDSASSDSSARMLANSASSTASLSASILEYREMYGRRYHSDRGNARYWTPNDDASTESLDIIHHVLTLSLEGELYLAPLDKEAKLKVVDIGTGTGIWAIDFADEHPDAEVVGTDISAIQPDWVPPNLHFEIDDCTQEWTFRENSLDYVHMRWLFGSIADWSALFAQAYKCLKPGGYIESHEPSVRIHSDDGSVLEGSAMDRFSKLFADGGAKMGRVMTVIEDGVQRKCAEEAGFVDIEEVDFKTPIGAWPKDPYQQQIGRYQQLATEGDIEGSMLHIAVGVLDWTKEEVIFFGSKVRREIRSPDIHGWYWQKIVLARKPSEPDPEGKKEDEK